MMTTIIISKSEQRTVDQVTIILDFSRINLTFVSKSGKSSGTRYHTYVISSRFLNMTKFYTKNNINNQLKLMMVI